MDERELTMKFERVALFVVALGLLLVLLHTRIDHAGVATDVSPVAGGRGGRRYTAIPPVSVPDEAQPHASTIRRNLFAFVEIKPRRVEAPQAPQPIAPATIVQTAPEPKQEAPREPEFPFRYIGRFGPEHDPIAVFVANGDVVNARIGELIAGQFRLTGVGIESVEIASGSGTSRRVALQP
jgi:hypothetical protein